MTPERWREIREVLHDAMQVPVERRLTFLDSKCSQDPALREEVESFLADEEVVSEAFLKAPALSGFFYAIGTRLGPYEIVGLIGVGGMGEVYRALDTRLARIVAIKLLPSSLYLGLFRQKQLQREARAISLLQHPNICTFYQLEHHEDIDFLVMEYVAGMSIDRYCDNLELSITERLKLFIQVCAAVHYAHQRLIIHRDLKPANILVSNEGAPKLLDFGLAKILDPFESSRTEHTVTLQRALTPAYASPEQIRGDNITTASDLYSLGVILYQLLTGLSPYGSNANNKQEEFFRAIFELQPERPSTVVLLSAEKTHPNVHCLSPTQLAALRRTSSEKLSKMLRGDLDNIVLMALRKEPQRRYSSVEQLAQDIQRHLDSQPISARKDSFLYRTSKFVNRHKLSVAAAAVMALTLVSALIVTVRANRAAQLQAGIAQREKARAERRFNDVRSLANWLIFELPATIHQLPGSVAAEKVLYDNGLKYLDSIAAEAEGDRSLQRELASAYKALGDSQGFPYGASLRDTNAALESYNKSLQMREKLLRSDPYNIGDQIDLAKLHRTIGALLSNAGYTQQGREQVYMALEVIRPLAQAHYESVDALRELGNVLLTIGNVEDERTGLPSALKYHLEAMQVFQKLADMQPDVELWQQQTAYMNASVLSMDYLKSALPSQAMRCAREGLETFSLLKKHAAASTEAALAGQMAVSHSSIGSILLFTGHRREAVAEFRSELEIFQKFFDRKDVAARGNFAESYINLGHAESGAGNLHEGLQCLRRGRAIVSTLWNGDGLADTWLTNTLVTALVWEGEALEDLGEKSSAVQSYGKAVAILDAAALKGGHTFDPLRATAYWKLAEAHAQLRHRRQARDAYLKGLEILDNPSMSNLNSIESKYSLSSIYVGLGDLSPGRSCPWYRKSEAIWKELPLRNSMSPDGFRVVEFGAVLGRLQICE